MLKSSSQEIERAAGRSGGFGRELKVIVSKILQNTLKLSARIELNDKSQPSEVVCTFAQNDHHINLDASVTERTDNSSGKIVTYTLAVHTDRPGGSLMFLSNVAGVGEYRFSCPSKFGKVYVHAISNLVGLDQNLALGGTDEVVISNFTKDPKRKTAPAAFQDSVKGVSDLRIKRSSSKKKSGAKNKGSEKRPNASSGASHKRSSAVTPSPKPQLATNTSGDITATDPIGEQSTSFNPYSGSGSDNMTQGSVNPRRQNSASFNPSRGGTALTSQSKRILKKAPKAWMKAKTEQRKFQQGAFHESSENPFSLFKYDP